MNKPGTAQKHPSRKRRCAIYTRKSTEEGLEQAFKLDRVYGHHSPDHLKGAADAITGKIKPRVSVVESVVGDNETRAMNQKSR